MIRPTVSAPTTAMRATLKHDMDELDIISVHWMYGRDRSPNQLNALIAGFTRMRLQPTVATKELKVSQSRGSKD